MNRLEEIKYDCHIAAMNAMDEVLEAALGTFPGKSVFIRNKHLSALLPALDAAIEAAMREVYPEMPESLANTKGVIT